MYLYHGTGQVIGNVDLSLCKDKRDFGVGFYTTTDDMQAKRWALSRFSGRQGVLPTVIRYTFDEPASLLVKKFTSPDITWLDFVTQHRNLGGVHHTYDIVMGPIADDNTYSTILLHLAGVYTKEETIKRLKSWVYTDQVSFHTERSLVFLTDMRWENVT